MSFLANEGTQTAVYTLENAGTEIQVVKLDVGSGTAISDFGGTIIAVNNLNQGTVRVSVGTISTGTLQNLVSGTVNALASGTITGGTLQNLVSGTVNALASGTVTAGTLTNLVSGTINALASGTITGGTLQNLVSGTVNTNLLPLSGVILTTAVAIGTTAGSIPATALADRKSIILYNNGTSTIYLGGSGVTTTNGLYLGTADYSPSFDIGITVLFGIASTAGGTVNALEVS